MTVIIDDEPDVITLEKDEKVDHGDDGFDGNSFDNGNGGNGGDDESPGPDPAPGAASRLSAGVLGMLAFVGSEIVLFAVMIFAFAWARAGQAHWPPPGQPRLPLLVTSLNTLVLLASGYTMYRAWAHIRTGRESALQKWLLATTALGFIFLLIQGLEWGRLIGFGLTASGNLYGAAFYVIIGTHALHVFIAVVFLMFVWYRSIGGAYTKEEHSRVVMCTIFWQFVVLIWPIIYISVYLV